MDTLNFCTLFDSYYLDKGLALYDSLINNTEKFRLYVFCFDQKAYDILNEMKLKNLELIIHSEFEDEKLLDLKKVRSRAEYCWTCTPVIIEYVLENFRVDECTYLDSDLYFYSDPHILFEEIYSHQADVVITPHRFQNNRYGKKLEKRNGKYCVEFNYFANTQNGRKVLQWWREQCFEWCYDIPEETRMGDQKYLNQFEALFLGVHVLCHLGGGVAPWNLEQYILEEDAQNDIWLKTEKGDQFQLIFYHFQNIRYFESKWVNIKSQTRNKRLKYQIYIPYLHKIEAIRRMLTETYGLDFSAKRLVRSSNPLVGFLQRNFAAFKVRYFSDIIDLTRLEQYK